jgi:hypothetical protein
MRRYPHRGRAPASMRIRSRSSRLLRPTTPVADRRSLAKTFSIAIDNAPHNQQHGDYPDDQRDGVGISRASPR